MENTTYCRLEQIEIIHLKNKPIVYPEHNHVSVYTIGLVLNGEVSLKSGNKSSVHTGKSCFVIAPYQVHSLILPKNYELISICVNTNLIETCPQNNLLGILVSVLPKFSSEINYNSLAVALNLVYNQPAFPPADSRIISSALSVYSSPECACGIEAMAKSTCYSLYHYIKLFKRHIGLTPHKFLTQNRIRKSQRMIEQGQDFTSIALELGFYDQSHFIKCFKKTVGFTPAEYSKCSKQIH